MPSTPASHLSKHGTDTETGVATGARLYRLLRVVAPPRRGTLSTAGQETMTIQMTFSLGCLSRLPTP